MSKRGERKYTRILDPIIRRNKRSSLEKSTKLLRQWYISKLVYLSIGSVIGPIIRKKKNTTPVNFHGRKRWHVYLFQRRRIVSKVVVSTNWPGLAVSRVAIYGTVFVHFEGAACGAQMRFQQLCVTVTRLFPPQINKPNNKYLPRLNVNKRFEFEFFPFLVYIFLRVSYTQYFYASKISL